MARRSEHSQDEIRTMILNAAEMIVMEDGAAGLKVRNIALAIGYTVGSIYMVFDDMADLTMHLKARTLDDLITHLQQAPTHGSATQCLHGLARAYLGFARQHYNRWQMLFEQSANTDVHYPDWYRAKYQQLFTLFENQFRVLILQPAFNELTMTTQTFLGGVHGVCSLLIPLYREHDCSNEVEIAVDLFVKRFLHGWLTNQDATDSALG